MLLRRPESTEEECEVNEDGEETGGVTASTHQLVEDYLIGES